MATKEANEKISLLLYDVDKEDEDDDRDFKDWEADQQYKWFVEGNDKDLFED